MLCFSTHLQTSGYDVASASVHSIYLDNGKKYLLRWEYDNDTITFNITAVATEWIGLGFSPRGGMVGADIAMIWFDTNGVPHITVSSTWSRVPLLLNPSRMFSRWNTGDWSLKGQTRLC